MRLKLIIAYDGAAFAGWQSQAHGRAAQDFMEAAVQKISGQRVTVHGSGRTDAGVHALAQCAHFDAESPGMNPADWQRALNGNLPPGLRIMKCTRAPETFHARFSPRGKSNAIRSVSRLSCRRLKWAAYGISRRRSICGAEGSGRYFCRAA